MGAWWCGSVTTKRLHPWQHYTVLAAGTDAAMSELTPAMRAMIQAMVAENTSAQVAAALEEERRKRKKRHSRSSRERDDTEGPEPRRHRARSDSRER